MLSPVTLNCAYNVKKDGEISMEEKDRIKTEKDYFNTKLSQVVFNPDRFELLIGDDKYLFGYLSGTHMENPFSRLMQYKTIYDTVVDLDWKIKLSFEEAIDYSCSKSVLKEYSIIKSATEEERIALYYIENALFRVSILWDLLAQFYRLYYRINVKMENVHYKKIFDPDKSYCKKFKNKAREINSYLNEKNDTDCEGKWKGNHVFVNKLRNKMTHRNSPNMSSISDYDMNMKHHPIFLIKRIIEDYVAVTKFITEILDNIEKEIVESFDNSFSS